MHTSYNEVCFLYTLYIKIVIIIIVILQKDIMVEYKSHHIHYSPGQTSKQTEFHAY